MHRINSPGATASNEFTDGDPVTGIPATTVWSKWLNTIQREIANLVEGFGLTLDPADDTQMITAISAALAAVPQVHDLEANAIPYTAVGQSFQFAHGLSRNPVAIGVVAKCTSASGDGGYSIGDKFLITNSSGNLSGTTYGNATYFDAKNIVVVGSSVGMFGQRKDNGNVFIPATGKWSIYVTYI